MKKANMLVLGIAFGILSLSVAYLVSLTNNQQNTILTSKEENILLQRNLDDLKTEHTTLNKTYNTQKESQAILQSNYTVLKNNYTALDNNYSKLRDNYTALRGNYNSFQANYTTLNNKYNKLYDDYNTTQTSYKNLQEDYNNLHRNNIALQENFDALKANYTTSSNNFADLNATYIDLENNFTILTGNYNSLGQYFSQPPNLHANNTEITAEEHDVFSYILNHTTIYDSSAHFPANVSQTERFLVPVSMRNSTSASWDPPQKATEWLYYWADLDNPWALQPPNCLWEAVVSIYNDPYNSSEYVVEVSRFTWHELTISFDSKTKFVFPEVTKDETPSLGYMTFRVTPPADLINKLNTKSSFT